MKITRGDSKTIWDSGCPIPATHYSNGSPMIFKDEMGHKWKFVDAGFIPQYAQDARLPKMKTLVGGITAFVPVPENEDIRTKCVGPWAPNALRLRNGDIMVRYIADEEGWPFTKAGIRSRDNGNTWTLDPIGTYADYCIGQMSDGTVFKIDEYIWHTGKDHFTGYLSRSKDGVTFEPVEEIVLEIPEGEILMLDLYGRDYTAYNPPYTGHGIPFFYRELADKSGGRMPIGFFGRHVYDFGNSIPVAMLWFALANQPEGYCGERSVWANMLIESRDGGRNWRKRSIIYDRSLSTNEFGESSICRLGNGDLLIVARAGGKWEDGKWVMAPMSMARSSDLGRTWSENKSLPWKGIFPDLKLLSNGWMALAWGRGYGNWLAIDRSGTGEKWEEPVCLLGESRHCEKSCGMNSIIETEPGKLLYFQDVHGLDEGKDSKFLASHGLRSFHRLQMIEVLSG